MDLRSPDFTQLTSIGGYDVKHLNAIIAQPHTKTVVSKAERVS
jgi:hypothetical protein